MNAPARNQSETDTRRLKILQAQKAQLLKQSADLARLARELDEPINELVQQTRPTYPTDAHLFGIAEAARRFRSNTPWKSHHGDPCGPVAEPYAVVATANRAGFTGIPDAHWLNVRSRGNNYADHIWRFGASDIEHLIVLIEAEGFTVVKDWAADSGHSFVVRPTTDPTL